MSFGILLGNSGRLQKFFFKYLASRRYRIFGFVLEEKCSNDDESGWAIHKKTVISALKFTKTNLEKKLPLYRDIYISRTTSLALQSATNFGWKTLIIKV